MYPMPFPRILLLLFCVTLSWLAHAQAGNPANASDSTSLRTQYDDMLRVSNRFQRFKVVPEEFLQAFIANVGDSITVYTEEINTLQGTITSQATRIEQLSKEVGARDTRITALEAEKENMSLLGMPLGKSSYALVMWTLVFGLLALAVFAFLRTRLALAATNEARAASEKLAVDLDKSKKRRLEVEQSLRRQLQDEINKRR